MAKYTSGGASVAVRNLSRSFGDVPAVNNVSLTIEAGEFVSLLGPSGGGKTTLLNIIAGFETADSGDALVDGKSIMNVPPHRRNMAMVFQHYALFPHMTVAENIAYPLRRRHIPRAKIPALVETALDMVRLRGLESRRPAQLSGGQQQRVALARALVFSPRVLLMDEPLGALDKRLRSDLQAEVKRLHRELGMTILFVTHDQEEALYLADRIVLLRNGAVEQVGAPAELWAAPATPFAADFIGDSNLLWVGIAADGMVSCGGERLAVADTSGLSAEEQHTLVLRPENLHVELGGNDTDSSSGTRLTGMLEEASFVGSRLSVRVKTSIGSLSALAPLSLASDLLVGSSVVTLRWEPSRAAVVPGVDSLVPYVN